MVTIVFLDKNLLYGSEFIPKSIGFVDKISIVLSGSIEDINLLCQTKFYYLRYILNGPGFLNE
jgi:hypothetical protein